MSQNHINPMPVSDPWLVHAMQNIEATYGDVVSVRARNADIIKFGHNHAVDAVLATIAHFPAGILHETYVSDNLINSVISDSLADTQEVFIEGHTIDGSGNFTFITQLATLNGQTVVALDTPVARVSRMYNNNSTDFAGSIYLTETDTYTAGVPNTDTKVHLIVHLDENQSGKAALTTASNEYAIFTSFSGDAVEKNTASVEVVFQIRTQGKIFRMQSRISASNISQGILNYKPYFIVPPNSDIRLTAATSGVGIEVSGTIQGVFAKIRGTE